MKYIFVKKNNPWISNVGNVKNFTSEIQRDEWVNNNLFNEGDDYKELLSSSLSYNNIYLDPVNNSVELDSSLDPQNGKSNMVITCNDDLTNITFHHINEFRRQTNQKMVDYELKVSVWLTYIDIVGNMKDFNLVKGHLPLNEYVKYEFDSGEKAIEKIEEIQRDTNAPFIDDLWVIVYRQNSDFITGGTGDLSSLNEGMNIRKYKSYTTNNPDDDIDQPIEDYKLPYTILCAPVKRIDTNISKKSISAFSLLGYISKYRSDGLTLKIQIVQYNILARKGLTSDEITNEEIHISKYADDQQPSGFTCYGLTNSSGILYIEDDNVEFIGSDPRSFLLIDRFEYDYKTLAGNKYTIKLPSRTTDIELLDGLRNFSLNIEGKKEIKIPFNETNKLQLTLYKEFAFDYNEGYETWRIDRINTLHIPSEDNSFINDTELTIFTNQLEQYKANEPINSKLDFLKPLGRIANPLNWLNPATQIAGTVNVATQELGTWLNRQNMKKAPEEVITGNGVFSNLAYGKIPFKLSIRHYKFIDSFRSQIIKNIYREGITPENKYNIESYEDIKRPNFNFLIIDNFIESNTNHDLPAPIIEEISNTLSSGVRIWNNDFKNYEVDNNDRL